MNARDDLQASNMAVVMDRGPGLSTRYSTWAEAVDTLHGCVLVGGLGGLGVGTMWTRFIDSASAWRPLLDSSPDRPGEAMLTSFDFWLRDKPYVPEPMIGDAAALIHWRSKAQAGEMVHVRCVGDDDPAKEPRCGTKGPMPDDAEMVCPYCDGALGPVGVPVAEGGEQ